MRFQVCVVAACFTLTDLLNVSTLTCLFRIILVPTFKGLLKGLKEKEQI